MPRSIPNALTIMRIALAPVLAITLQPDQPEAAALAVFAIGMASDVLDGWLARSRRLVTNFGKLMDPIADKVFIGTAVVALAATDRIAVWVVVVVFVRELLVTALRFAARREGTIIAASPLGKAKTVIQTVTVFVLIAAGPVGLIAQALVYLMVAVTVISGADYIASYARRRPMVQPAAVEALRAT